MDPLRNPFSPGAGSPPPELVGRDPVLDQARILLGRTRLRRPEKSMLLTGLRGVGKTVLLNEIKLLALAAEYRVLFVEASENQRLGVVLAQFLRPILYDLSRAAGTGEKVRRSLAVLRSFIGGLKVTVGDVTFGLDIDPERGSADSGDLEMDLPDLFGAVGEAAVERKAGVAILIDELQYFSQKELAALIMAMHRVQQGVLPIILVGAGLPVLPAMAGESKSYAERLFNFPDIGALSKSDARKAVQDPASEQKVRFEDEALDEIYRVTEGYPYFIQEWAYQSWNLARTSPITRDTVQDATSMVTARLDQNFFRVRYDRLRPSEKQFLRAMAERGRGPHRAGDVAETLGVKVQSIQPVRAKLIRKGMIYSPAHGDLAFTVPLFDEFMRRAMPEIRR